jgi:trigger factor
MKERFIRSAAIIAVACLCIFSLASCSLTDIFGKDYPDTTLATQASDTTTAAPETTVARPEKPSLIELDMEKYLSLDYKGLSLSVKKLPKAVTDDDVNAEIEGLIKQLGKYTLITDRAPVEGDTLEISYVGTMNGEEFQGGKSDKATILLDKKNSGYIEGFADALYGAACGDTVTAELTFPTDYYEHLAGKAVTFKITIKGICNLELTDDIAKEISKGEKTTAAEYRAHVKEYLELEIRHATIDEVYEEMWDLLIERATVTELYAPLYDFYHADFINSIVEYANYYGISYNECLKTLGFDETKIDEMAKESAIGDMIIYYIAAKEGITVTDEEYKEYLEDYVEYYKEQGMNYTVETLEKELEDYYGEGYVYTQLLSGDVIFAVFDSATLVEKPAETK